MIVKLNININNIQKYINDLKDDYDIYYHLNNLYAASKNVTSMTLSDFIKKYHCDDITVTEINADNLKFENDRVVNWCKNEFIEYDIKRFEMDHQQQINDYMIFLDDLEAELKKISQEKRGDVRDGRKEK